MNTAVFEIEVDRLLEPLHLNVNPECVARIHRAYAVAMVLLEAGPDPGGSEEFTLAAAGLGCAHYARLWINK